MIAALFLGVGENAAASKLGLNSATPARAGLRARRGVEGVLGEGDAAEDPPGVKEDAAGLGMRGAEPGRVAFCGWGENDAKEGVAGVFGARE